MINWLRRKYYLFQGRCPNCKEKCIGYGQWNDGALFNKPVCFNSNCPLPAEKELHDFWEKPFDEKYPKDLK